MGLPAVVDSKRVDVSVDGTNRVMTSGSLLPPPTNTTTSGPMTTTTPAAAPVATTPMFTGWPYPNSPISLPALA